MLYAFTEDPIVKRRRKLFLSLVCVFRLTLHFVVIDETQSGGIVFNDTFQQLAGTSHDLTFGHGMTSWLQCCADTPPAALIRLPIVVNELPFAGVGESGCRHMILLVLGVHPQLTLT